jgi:hypothetical protein
MTHGRESKTIALLAANASVEASMSAFELVAQLLADGQAAPRRAAPTHAGGSRGAHHNGKENVIAMRALG